MAALGFELACMCIRNCGVVLKDCASRSAVSAVTLASPARLIEAHGPTSQCLAAGGLRHPKRLQELLEKNLARVDRRSRRAIE